MHHPSCTGQGRTSSIQQLLSVTNRYAQQRTCCTHAGTGESKNRTRTTNVPTCKMYWNLQGILCSAETRLGHSGVQQYCSSASATPSGMRLRLPTAAQEVHTTHCCAGQRTRHCRAYCTDLHAGQQCAALGKLGFNVAAHARNTNEKSLHRGSCVADAEVPWLGGMAVLACGRIMAVCQQL